MQEENVKRVRKESGRGGDDEKEREREEGGGEGGGRRKREKNTLEHRVLKEMSIPNPCPQSSGKPVEKKTD